VTRYLMTAGHQPDYEYQFLTERPAWNWWRDYRDWTSFERPTMFVESNESRWTAYLAAIPSVRLDFHRRRVRFTLAMEGTCGSTPENGRAVELFRVWLEDMAELHTVQQSDDRGRLGSVLDTYLEEHLIEQAFAAVTAAARQAANESSVSRGHPGGPAATDQASVTTAEPSTTRVADLRRRLDEQLEQALHSFGESAGVQPVATNPELGLLGRIGDPQSRRKFLEAVRYFIENGRKGRAVYLNLAAPPESRGWTNHAILYRELAPRRPLDPERADLGSRLVQRLSSNRGLTILALFALAVALVAVVAGNQAQFHVMFDPAPPPTAVPSAPPTEQP